jgi:AraC-like DNA-binding protein
MMRGMDIFPGLTIEKASFGSRRLSGPWSISVEAGPESHLYVVLGHGAWFQAPTVLTKPLWCPPGSSLSAAPRVPHIWSSDLDQPLTPPFPEFPLEDVHLRTKIAADDSATTFLVGRAPIERLRVLVAWTPLIYIPPHEPQMRRILGYLARIERLLHDRKKSFATRAAILRFCEILVFETTRYWMKNDPNHLAYPLIGVQEPHIFNALKALHARLDHPWTTEALAKEANLSRSAFVARFRKFTGRAPLRYLRLVRLRTAPLLMRREKATLAEIAYAVGYSSEASFIRAFNREFKMTPSEFKRRYMTQWEEAGALTASP